MATSWKNCGLIFLISLLGCPWANAASEPTTPNTIMRQQININADFKKLNLKEPTFAGTVDQTLTTAFLTDSQHGDDGQTSVLIDATEGKSFFPLEKMPRKFNNKQEVHTLLAHTFLPGNLEPYSGYSRYTQLGDTYFYNPDRGMAYRITDPVLAYLGGVTGKILINNKIMCLDPDEDCENGYPSYLSPVGQTTAPTDVDFCGRLYAGVPVCVHHHTFYSRPFGGAFYTQFGTNTRFTTWAAYPFSEIHLNIRIGTEPREYSETLAPAIGVNFAEVGQLCWGGGCPVQLQTIDSVCGSSIVIDPDLDSRLTYTGAGPGNYPESFACTEYLYYPYP